MGLVEKSEGLSKIKTKPSDTDNNMVITSRKGGWGMEERARGENGDGRRLDLGW